MVGLIDRSIDRFWPSVFVEITEHGTGSPIWYNFFSVTKVCHKRERELYLILLQSCNQKSIINIYQPITLSSLTDWQPELNGIFTTANIHSTSQVEKNQLTSSVQESALASCCRRFKRVELISIMETIPLRPFGRDTVIWWSLTSLTIPSITWSSLSFWIKWALFKLCEISHHKGKFN